MVITAASRPSDAPPQAAVTAACEAVYRHWRRFLPHSEALEQAEHFARHFEATTAVPA